MAQSTKSFWVFISSTFSDLKHERNAIREQVFPRLRALCQQHSSRFQPIDLHWGVSEEASLDQQVLNICLGEITRCQQTRPRPNFIVLLGDRYGWCPPLAQVSDREFQEIMGLLKRQNDQVSQAEYRLLVERYNLDENAVPPKWRFNLREKPYV